MNKEIEIIDEALKDLELLKTQLANLQVVLKALQDDLGQEPMVQWHKERELPEPDEDTDDIPF